MIATAVIEVQVTVDDHVAHRHTLLRKEARQIISGGPVDRVQFIVGRAQPRIELSTPLAVETRYT